MIIPKNQYIRRLAISHFLLECQFWFPIWMVFLTTRGFDLVTLVLADGVFRFTMVLLEFPMGIFSDWIGRKKTYSLICFLAIVTYIGIIMVDNPYMLFSVWILWGIFWALYSGVSSSYCYEIILLESIEDDSFNIFGFMTIVASGAALFSHLFAGFLYSIQSEFPFIINGVFALCGLFISLTLPEISKVKSKKSLSFKEFIKIPFQNNMTIICSALLSIALIYFWSPRILMQPLFIELNLSFTTISITYFFYSFAGVLAGIYAIQFRKFLGDKLAIFTGFFSIWIGVILIGLIPGHFSLLFFPLLSFGYYTIQTLLEVMLHQELENHYRASILSVISLLGGIVIIFSRPFLGLLADLQNTSFAFSVWAFLGIFVIIIVKVSLQKLSS